MGVDRYSDFLPFSCDGCGQIFCLKHKSKDSHGCDKHLLETGKPEYEGPKGYPCSAPDCKGRELLEVICPHCHLNFCLSHRHQVEHSCKNLITHEPVISKTAEHVKQILERHSHAPKVRRSKGSKSAKTAAKVALMKLKMKSVGDKGTPETEKVYLNVALPLTCPIRYKAMFFSKTWSIGRIIDNIAESCSLQNDNNTVSEKKLRLFSAETGSLLLTSEGVQRFIQEEELFSGSTVILEYVTDNTPLLSNLDEYIT